MKTSSSLFLLWLQGGVTPLVILFCSSMVPLFQELGCFFLPLGPFCLRKHTLPTSSCPQLFMEISLSLLHIRAWNSRGCWEKHTWPNYREEDSFILFSMVMGTNLPYNFVANAIQMILLGNKDLFGSHFLVLFLDVEVAGIFSPPLTGLTINFPHIINSEALLYLKKFHQQPFVSFYDLVFSKTKYSHTVQAMVISVLLCQPHTSDFSSCAHHFTQMTLKMKGAYRGA